MEGWWIKYILPSKEGTVTLEQFLEKCGSEYNADKAAYTAKMTTCFNTIFDVIDTNKDRSKEITPSWFTSRDLYQSFHLWFM
jgi:hypothetical protein